jgi:hypothetical protein
VTGSQNRVQYIFGVYDPVSGRLIGVTPSGNTPPAAVLGNAALAGSFAALRLQVSSIVQTVFATGKVVQADGGAGTFVYNPADTTSGAWFVGSVSGAVLTVASVNNGTLAVGQSVNRSDTGAAFATISSFGTGSGGVGTYNLSASATLPLATMSADNNSTILVGLDGSRWDLATAGLLTSSTIYGTDSGAVNAYVFTHAAASGLSSLSAGTLIRFIPLNTNTGAATLNADGSGAVAILRANGTALTGGELSALGAVELQSTGTQWQIVTTAGALPGNERTAAELAAAVVPTNYNSPGVQRYGADNTGVADSNTAIGKAVSVALNNPISQAGGEVFFPAGSYTYSGTGLTWNAPNVSLRGVGIWDGNQLGTPSSGEPAPTQLTYTGSASAIQQGNLYNGGAGTPYGGFRMTSLKLQGSATAQDGVRILYGNAAKIEDCLIRGFTGTTYVDPETGFVGSAAIRLGNRQQDTCVINHCELSFDYIGLALNAVNDVTAVRDVEIQYNYGPGCVLGGLVLGTTSHDLNFINCQWGFNAQNTTQNPVFALGTLTGGTLYTAGTYTNVPLTGGSGTNAHATIVVAGGAVTTVTITTGGQNYVVGDTLSAAAANIGGTGSGFTVIVNAVGTVADLVILSGSTINFMGCYFEQQGGQAPGATSTAATNYYCAQVGDVTGNANSTNVTNVTFWGCIFAGNGSNYCIKVANNRCLSLSFYNCQFQNYAVAAIDNSQVTGIGNASVFVDPSCALVLGTPAFYSNNDIAHGVTDQPTGPITGPMSITAFGSNVALTLNAAPSATAMNVNGSNNLNTAQFISGSTTNQAQGVLIQAGTSASDSALTVINRPNTATFLDIFGTGDIQGRGVSICKRATAIEQRTSTVTLTNSTQLTYNIPAAGTYEFELGIFSYFTTAVTDGITANVNYSGTFTAVGSYLEGYFMNGTTTTTGIQPVEVSATVNNALAGLTLATYGAGVAPATPAIHRIKGNLVATGTGTLAFAFAQSTSGVDTANLGVGSYMKVTQLS